MIVEAIRDQPAGVPPVTALLEGMRSVFLALTEEEWASERRRQRIFQAVPELRARAMSQTVMAIDMLAGTLAERDGRTGDDLTYRVIAGAMVGVVMAITPPGTATFEEGDFRRLEEALHILEENFRLR
ncbi:acyl-CoA-like ligand-binding transcription factor [Paractinoplanes durhamensis]|uniref:acyl-CoA-like ligand-binding transcription factor n=1 Tax=Paractinoplanes durhamensis TaxID=113563 RepID=UPI003636ED72